MNAFTKLDNGDPKVRNQEKCGTRQRASSAVIMKMGCRICELLSDQSQHTHHSGRDHVIMTPPNHLLLPQLREMVLAAYLLRGYYQPAGPLISAHHHQHSLPKASVLPTLEASPTSTPPTNAPSAPPPISASTSSGTRGGDESSDNDVVITASSCHNPTSYPPGPPSQSAPTYRYQTYALPPTPQHHQYGYPSQYPAPQYYPVAGGQGGGYVPAPPHYHNADLCYTTPSYPPTAQYYHKSYSTPPPVTYPRRYGPPPPPPHPSQYYPAELYPPPPEQQVGRQMVATASTSYQQQPPPGDAYPHPHPQQAPAPAVPMVDAYPPPPAPGYYPGYPPPAPPPCYSHSPPARSLAYIDTAYQGCPCPMQSCPKNVNTGPLTGEGKGPRPSAACLQRLLLPPVALALPSEPPHAGGPPSPARGSAGMHPTPSPCPAAAAQAYHPAKRAQATPSESRVASASPPSPASPLLAGAAGRGGGLLALHVKPCAAPPSAELRAASRVGTVHVGKGQTLTRCVGKPERAVKLEAEPSAEEDALVVGRKRKMKAECSGAPKSKRPAAKARLETPPVKTRLESPPVKVRLESPSEDAKATSPKTKRKNQPLSTANGCGVLRSKPAAKRRRLGAEILAENQAPFAGVVKGEPTTKGRSKEKPRPRLCPPNRDAKAPKVDETSTKTQPPCDLTATTLGSNGVVVPAKSASKPAPRSVPKARRRPAKCQLKDSQPKLDNVDETIFEVVNMSAVRKAARPRLGKALSVPDCVVAEVGKVTNRRKTDSDAAKTSHMLRSHGIHDDWEPIPTKALPTGKRKGKASAKRQGRKKAVLSVDLGLSLTPKKGQPQKPKWNNGWCWEGESFQGRVLLNSEGTSVERLCYPSMRHKEGDLIRPLDCVLLRSGGRRLELPYIAKVAQLWENPDDNEMMVSLLWYYRPEHTDQGRRGEDMPDEVFASKHKDANSVACIEDKCYVLTFNEYCRYRAGSRRQLDSGRDVSAVVPLPPEYPRASRQPASSVSPDMVFFCRRVYDFRQKRILKNPC